MPVVDASVALAYLFPDEDGAVFEHLQRDHADELVAPDFFDLELLNAILGGVRKGRFAPEQGDALALPVLRVGSDAALVTETFSLARTHGISGYDALYLALAKMRGVPLATGDRRLRSAAEAENVPLLP